MAPRGQAVATNELYYGDNLQVLRDSIASDSIDLVYLDPPFNSRASYNILFRAASGEQSKAQIEAFEVLGRSSSISDCVRDRSSEIN